MDPKNSHGPDRADYREEAGDLTEVHASIQREHPEPTAESTPIPMWLIATCGVAVCWAGYYLGSFNGAFKGDVFNELNTSAGMLFPAPQKANSNVAAVSELSLADQGKAIYANCAACHQPSGQGTPGAIPPLVASEYVLGSEKRLVAILLKGIGGALKVKGVGYNGAMPAWESQLTDKKIAAVATYVRSAWGNTAPEITPAKVAAARKEFEGKSGALSEADLQAIPDGATLPDAAGGSTPAAKPAGAAAPAANSTAAAAPAAAATASSPAPAASANPAPAASAASPAANGAAPAGTPSPAGTNQPLPPLVPASPPAAATPEQLAKGKSVYMTCMPCHQITGAGLPPVFPPLTNSPYVNGSAERFIAMVLKGNAGPMTIDNKPYNNMMPAQETALDDEKIAAVTTYVRASFNNSALPISAEQVAAARAKFAERKTPWTQPELDAWKE